MSAFGAQRTFGLAPHLRAASQSPRPPLLLRAVNCTVQLTASRLGLIDGPNSSSYGEAAHSLPQGIFRPRLTHRMRGVGSELDRVGFCHSPFPTGRHMPFAKSKDGREMTQTRVAPASFAAATLQRRSRSGWAETK
jgi:hypothetical protein